MGRDGICGQRSGEAAKDKKAKEGCAVYAFTISPC